MYLAILLIIVALLVFYNEINNKLNVAEYMLLIIALIAIISASIDYIKFDKINEGFTSNITQKDKFKDKFKDNIKNKFNNKKVEYDDFDDTMIIKSEDSNEYLDSDDFQINKNSNSFTNPTEPIGTIGNVDDSSTENKINSTHINQVNELLGISSNFTDIPIPSNYKNENDEIKSIFSPKVLIGKGNDNNSFGGSANSWNSAFSDDGFGFDNTMNPVNNLWRDTQGFYDKNYNDNGGGRGGRGDEDRIGDEGGRSGNCNSSNSSNGIDNDQWSQNMDSYNKGKWNRNQYSRPSDYVDYTTPKGYGTTTPDSLNNENDSSNGEPNKLCASYNNLDENQAGNLIVKDYTQSKKWVAGYTYVPPIHWDVPQRHTPVCNSSTPNVQKLTGLMDRGLPINALELNQNGKIANTEDTVKLSNVGSMVSRFNYQEQPFSKPYV